LLAQPYILDIAPTVKPVYGNQKAAEIGYHPKKPGKHEKTIKKATAFFGLNAILS
jgi:hypothetical protein